MIAGCGSGRGAILRLLLLSALTACATPDRERGPVARARLETDILDRAQAIDRLERQRSRLIDEEAALRSALADSQARAEAARNEAATKATELEAELSTLRAMEEDLAAARRRGEEIESELRVAAAATEARRAELAQQLREALTLAEASTELTTAIVAARKALGDAPPARVVR